MAEITRKVLPLSDLETNTGQLEGVPSNPRQWTMAEVDKLAKSLKETPELLAMRAPIVTPCGDKYVVLGGNMRVQALRKNKVKEVECEIIEGITPEKAKEIVIKDNGSFGAWDYDQLANEWDDLELQEWGVMGIPDTRGETETEKLSKLEYDPLYYEPEERPKFSLRDCVDLSKFNAKMEAVAKMDLTDEQWETMKLFAYRFIKIDFQRVADYYRWWATDEEKRAIERLRCVLVDGGGIDGFIEDGLLRLMEITNIKDFEDND